ncbi:DNA helicase [Synechococcus phage S-CRES3]|nr:DNA helicase [Synechococcus phage S-CRES3]
MTLPHYIQKAVDLGLLTLEDGKITSCNKDAVETVLGTARLIEKIQPTTVAKADDTTDQEAIVLCRVLSAPTGKARQLWADLRVAFGIGHGQSVPMSLWSTPVFKAIGNEVDRTFMGERNSAVVSRESLITQYADLNEASRIVGMAEFNKSISELAQPETMDSYGDAKSEWDTALDILRQRRVRALYKETLHDAEQVGRGDSKLEKNIEFLQSRAMECLGMLRGSVGQQGNAVDIVEDLFGDGTNPGFLDQIMSAREQEEPVSTGIKALDIDMEGGVYRPCGINQGGRMFALAARTGVGKTQIAVQVAAQSVVSGLTVGFISAELDRASIYSRLWASITKKTNARGTFSGKIAAPSAADKEQIAAELAQAGGALQNSGGKLMVEAPWGACVETVVNSMRQMKAKNPELRLVVVDHFHALSRHKGAPTNEAAMMEERAYKLMTAAKELDIDLIVLAQMNRVGMDALSKKQAPGLDQLRGTDALAHVCHAVWIVRLEPTDEEHFTPGQARNLELWHAKVRGRQAYWNSQEQRVKGIRGFIDKSVITMDHATSSIASDDTGTSIGKYE